MGVSLAPSGLRDKSQWACFNYYVTHANNYVVPYQVQYTGVTGLTGIFKSKL